MRNIIAELAKFIVVSLMAALGFGLVGIQFNWTFVTGFGAWLVFSALLIATGKFDA